jgi:hypothetical protein
MLWLAGFLGFVLWARFGSAGLTVMALLVIGLAVENLLNTHWKQKSGQEKPRPPREWARPRTGVNPLIHRLFPPRKEEVLARSPSPWEVEAQDRPPSKKKRVTTLDLN